MDDSDDPFHDTFEMNVSPRGEKSIDDEWSCDTEDSPRQLSPSSPRRAGTVGSASKTDDRPVMVSSIPSTSREEEPSRVKFNTFSGRGPSGKALSTELSSHKTDLASTWGGAEPTTPVSSSPPSSRSPRSSAGSSPRLSPRTSSPRMRLLKSDKRNATIRAPSGVQVPDFCSVKRLEDGSWSGWLFKQKAQGRINLVDGGWKPRFCEWDPGKCRLYYYHYEGEKECANFISFDSKTSVEPAESECCPEPELAGCSFRVTASYTHRPYVFCAGSPEACDEWVQELLDAVSDMERVGQEILHDADQIWESYEASVNTVANEPALDIVIEEGSFSSKGEYFVACYCKGDQKFRTWISHSTKDPIWSCDGTFVGAHEKIRLKAFSRNPLTGTHKHIADLTISVEDFPEGQIVDQWFVLSGARRSEARVRLKIHKTTCFDTKNAMNGKRGIPTGVLPLRLDTGDLILFHNKHLASQATKVFTMSQWDHIGIVLRWADNELKLFEATSNGVGLYKLKARLEFLHKNTKMAVRRLQVERTRDMVFHMDEFIQQMRGRHYKKRFGVLVKAAISNEKERGTEDQDLSSVFCSELVVAAYQRMGLVSDKFAAKGFLPKDLADKDNKALSLLNGASLERKRIFSRKKDRDKIE